jgi:hypothetical protein
MSPPFHPVQRAKGQKNTGGCCCKFRKGMIVVGLSREGLSGKGNVELYYLLFIIFSYLMICG